METEEQRLAREADERGASAPMPALPLVKSVKTSSGSTSATKYGPGMRAAEDELALANEEAVGLARGRSDIEDMKLEEANRAIDLKYGAYTKAEERRADIDNRAGAEIAAADADYLGRVRKHADAKITDFWADKSGGQRALAAFGIMLGSLGQGVLRANGVDNAQNEGQRVLDQAISQDYQRKLANIDKMKDEIAFSKGRTVDARARKDEMRKDADAWLAGKYEGFALLAEKAAAKAGTAEAKAKYEAIANVERQKGAAAGIDAQERSAKKVTANWNNVTTVQDPVHALGGAAKPLTGPQSDAAGSLKVLVSNLEAIRGLQKQGVKISPEQAADIRNRSMRKNAAENSAKDMTGGALVSAVRMVPGVGDWAAPQDALKGLSPAQKDLYNQNGQAQKQIVKIMSGMGSTNAEVESYDLGFGIQADDTPETTERKLQMFFQYARELSVKTGPAQGAIMERVERIAQPVAPAASAPVREMKTHPRTGQKIMMEKGPDGRWRAAQ